ncbi:paraquat-inducible protein A [Fragilaria crotonensis]|nr:paraquat-inducible protein A [Fragilaria crotonensis]
MPSIFSDFTDRFIALDDDGSPKANSVIRNATEAQSNVEGRLNITEPFAFTFAVQNSSSAESLVSRVDIISKSISVSNLDSVVAPLQLLDVVAAHRLANSIHLGQISGRPVMLSTDLLFQIEGENSPLAVSNLFKVTLSCQSDLEAVILTTLAKKQFLEFPLRDLANPWCWLAALPVPELDQAGEGFDQAHNRGLQLDKFGLSIVDLDMNLECISCTSYGGEALPEIVAALRESGTISLVQERLQTLLSETARNYWKSFEFDSRIVESRKACPSSPYHNSSVDSSFKWPGLPSLSRESTESMIIFAALAVNFGMVLTAESHTLRPAEPTSQLSGEESLQFPQDGHLIDWRDPGDSIGKWASPILDEARTYAGSLVEDEETGEIVLRANVLAKELLKNGALSVFLNDIGLSGMGMKGNITEFRVFGLDSMLDVDILDVIGARTLSNRLKFDRLRLELDVTVEAGNSVEIATFAVVIEGIDVNLTVLLAVDWRKLGTMRVGSILQLKKVVPCAVSKFHAMNVTQLLATVDSVGDPRVLGFLSSNASETLSLTSQRFLDRFSDDVVASIPKICDITVREVINRILLEVLRDDGSYCTLDEMASSGELIDFRDLLLPENMAAGLGGEGGSPYGDTFRVIYQALQEKLSRVSETNQTFINELIRNLTFEQSKVNGSLLFPGVMFNDLEVPR